MSTTLKTHKWALLAVLGTLWFSSVTTLAYNPEIDDPYFDTYVLYLVHRGSNITLDPTRQLSHELVAKEFVQPLTGLRPWYGQVLGETGRVLANFSFDVPVADGPFTIQAPYFPNAYAVTLADNQQQIRLRVDVSTRAVCREDGFCDSERGENDRNCSLDCRARLTGAPSPSVSELPAISGSSSGIWSGLLLLAIGIGSGAVYWWYRKRNQTLVP